MGAIQYNFAHITELSTQIQSVSHQIEALLGEVSSEVTKLVAAWEGGASEQWHALQQKWNTEADDLKGALHDLGSKVDEAGHSMHQTESQVQSTFA